jgi:hypothetical protein
MSKSVNERESGLREIKIMGKARAALPLTTSGVHMQATDD